MSRACRRYMWCRSSKSTQKSSSPRKKSWSRYLTPNIFVSSLDMRMYHLCKLNTCVPRLISSSSVTKGFPSLNGTTTTLAIGISAVPAACSSVNPVSWRNYASCSFGCLRTTSGSSSFCTEPSRGIVFPHFLFLCCCAFISVRSKSEGSCFGPGGLFKHE